MKLLVVDDEASAVEVLCKRLREVLGDDVVLLTARNGRKAIDAMRREPVDVVFLDVEMPGMSGLEVAKHIKQKYPKTNVIMCTAYEQYALKAWELYVSGYIVKPASPDDIRKALNHLRTPVVERLKVQCFGNFEVFFNGEIVVFGRSGAKELFAYLVNRRGAGVSSGELSEVLRSEAVEPELKKASVRKYVMEIRKALSRIGFEGTLRHTRDSYSVHPDRLDCDYYRFLEGDPSAVKLYNGEYMSQYGWAEPTIAMLESMRQDVST